MKAFQRTTVSGAIGLALSLSHLPASAFCRSTTCELQPEPCERDENNCVAEGAPFIWTSPCLTYAVQVDGSARIGLDADEVEQLLADAFQLWSSVECPGGGHPGFSARFAGYSACDRQQAVCGGAEANDNVLMFRDDEWPEGYAEEAVGLTTVVADLDSGVIFDADIEINSANYERPEDPGRFDWRAVVAHEVGHYLGLAHSDVPQALMGPFYNKQSGPTLSEDDILGICEIFPPIEGDLACGSASLNREVCAETDLSEDPVCPGETRAGGCGCLWGAGARPHSTGPAGLLFALLLVFGLRRCHC